jgi:hypothetical protein
MKFTYYDQTVDLLPEKYLSYWPTIHDRVVINVSGGLDSASLLFLLCKYFPKIEKHVFTGDDVNHPIDAFNAENVVNHIMKKIPSHNIKSHDFISFDDMNPEILKEVKLLVEKRPEYRTEFPYIKRSLDGRCIPHKFTDEEMFYGKIAKPLLNDRNTSYIMKKYKCEVYLSGMTMNPPDDEMKRLKFYHLAEKKRNESYKHILEVKMQENIKKIYKPFNKGYQPFHKVNKLFVKGILEEHSILDEIYPLTGSCTGGANITKLWTEPCKECFWCHERKWAFGKF